MRRDAIESHRSTLAIALSLGVLSLAGCGAPDDGGAPATVFEGARVIVGDGSPPIEDAVFVVQGDRITAVGPRSEVEAPAGATRVDLAGKTVMPAVVNAHAHLSAERAERVDQMQHMAYYGAGVVVSLGLDDGDTPFQMRGVSIPDGPRTMTAGRGITAPEPGRSEVPYWVTTEDEARAAVRELATQEVDFVKIWVDDRGGQYAKLTPPLYGAVIDEAHSHGLRVAAHVFTLQDAKGLLRAGIDVFAHGIRDMDVDDELVQLWRERPEVVLIPNLPGPGVALEYDWLDGTVPADRIREMEERSADRPAAQASFGIQARNLARLNAEGVRIAFGTDGSTPWALHEEMEDMVRTGMTPAEVIVAATRSSAELTGVTDAGTITAGMSADFIVLDANPLEDIANTRRIADVYLRGVALDRMALGARLRGEAQ